MQNVHLLKKIIIMEQLTYDSSSSEDDLQIIEHESCDKNSSDQEAAPAKKQKMDPKARKKMGAAIYKTKFQSSWKSKYPFISPVAHDTSSFHCSVCNKDVSCAHQGEHDVIRHIGTAQHKKAAKSLKNMQKLSFLPRSDAVLLKDKVSVDYC